MLHRNVSSLKGDADVRKSDNSSDSSSTGDEERLRRLFQACDQDGDGFIDSHDLLTICQQLGMEDAVDEIMQELKADAQGRISFQEFSQCRMHLVPDIEEETFRLPARSPQKQQTMASNQIGAWRSGSENSLGAISQPPESLDYDSGARDCSPEPTTLQKLIETHDPYILQHLMESSRNRYTTQNFVDLANSLHLSTMSSLKGEIMGLSNRLQHVKSERDHLERQLSKMQSDRLHLQREFEDRIEEQSLRYEERITELHSVIAELRRKVDRHQINIIREEDEDLADSDTGKSIKDDCSVNENNANESQPASVADMVLGSDLNAELSRVVSELESAIDQRKKIAIDTLGTETGQAGDVCGFEQQAIEVSQELEELHLPPAAPLVDVSQLEEEIRLLREERLSYEDRLGRQETELNKMRAQLGSMREERDKMKRKVRDLQRAHSLELSGPSSPQHSRTSTPTKQYINPSTGERSAASVVSSHSGSYELPHAPGPVAKIAELKKLKTSTSAERQVFGAEISSMGLPNTKVAEHLAQSLQECSNMQEIVQTVYKCGNEMSEGKIREFEVETERLTSRIDHLKSQNDVLNLTLEESKAYADRLSVLMGKYESNNTALQLAINYSDQALEALEVLLALVESDQGVLLANCRAAGLGSLAGDSYSSDEQQEITTILQRAHDHRKTSESLARQLLHKLDRSCGMQHIPGCTATPWEDLSSSNTGSTGRTTSTTSSTASDTEFTKVDERRLRDYIQQLKNDRAAVKMTVLELESVHIDPMPQDVTGPSLESQRLDLENAVLMQELMAMKEEKAELRAQNYLLEKEKKALELRINGKESQEQAYLVQIEHLKSEMKEQHQWSEGKTEMEKQGSDSETPTSRTPSITLAELRTSNSCDIAQDLSDSLKREKMLKNRVAELMSTLEKLSRNSEIRHQQSAEFVNDLKRANSALISAFEKAKKRYQAKVKKLEVQVKAISENYEEQVHGLKQRITTLEEDLARPSSNETSL